MKRTSRTLIKIILVGLAFVIHNGNAGAGNPVENIKKLIEAGKLQLAKQQLDSLSENSQISEKNVLTLCDALVSQDQLPTAISFLEQQRSFHPNSTIMGEQLADYYLQTEQTHQAIDVYEEMASDNPDHRDYWLRLGKLYSWTEQEPKAIQAYEQALKLDSTDVAIMKKLNKLYQWNSREKDALAIQRKILHHEPGNVALWKQHGIQARWSDRNIEATVSFKNILRRDPKNIEAYFLLGETYLWMEKTEKAALCFRQVLKMDPDHTKARFYYAQLQQWQPFGWWDARKNYRIVLQQHPGHKESLKYLKMIRKNYGPLLNNKLYYIRDSNDLKRTEMTSEYKQYLSPHWQMKGEILFRQLAEQKPTGHFSSWGNGAKAGGIWHASQNTQCNMSVGFIHFNQSGSFGLAKLQWQQTLSSKQEWPGQLYATSSVKYDQVLDGVLAVKNGYTAKRIQQSFFWKPISAVKMSADLQYSWYSDQNRKKQLYFLGDYIVYSGSPTLSLQVQYEFEDMERFYFNSVPYWTPDHFWTRSVGLDALFPIKPSCSLLAGYALTQQSGNELANNWKIKFDWHINEFSHLFIHYIDFGSKYYSYQNVQIGFSYRF